MQLSIASYLDDSATQQVRQLQQTMSEVTGSTASLNSWQPHVTLGDGIDVTKNEIDNLIDEMQRVAQTTHKFDLTMTGFGSLGSRPIGEGEISTTYAIFINVIINQDLVNLVDKIDEITNNYSIWYHMPRPYLPHATLAFRDLSEQGYHDGLNYLGGKNIALTSSIDHIALVEKTSDSDMEFIRIPLD